MITLYTDRLTIRESSGRDFSRIYAMMLSECAAHGRRSVTAFGTVSEDEDEELEKYLAYIHTVYSVFGFGLCTVELGRTGEIIGWCGLQPVGDDDTPLGRIELGYLIGENYRGQGYGYEACREILRFAFERLELEEVYVRIDGANIPSLKLAGKLGFSKKRLVSTSPAPDNLYRMSLRSWKQFSGHP